MNHEDGTLYNGMGNTYAYQGVEIHSIMDEAELVVDGLLRMNFLEEPSSIDQEHTQKLQAAIDKATSDFLCAIRAGSE